MRHNNEDELVEIADDEGRDELVAEITALYEGNALHPTLASIELEKVLRIYLETADTLLDARNEIEAEVIEEKLDELELLVAQLRAAVEEEEHAQISAAHAESIDVFVLPGNDTIQ